MLFQYLFLQQNSDSKVVNGKKMEKKVKIQRTRLVLKKQNIIQALLILVLIVLINILSSLVFFRLDLTKEKKFTISPVSRMILSGLDDKVYIEVFFESEDLPAEMLRYKKVVKEFLSNLQDYNKNIEVTFKNPFVKDDPELNRKIYLELYNKGLNPTYISQAKESGYSEKLIFAGALVKYKEREFPVNLINNNASKGTSIVGLSETELERDFVHAIWLLSNKKVRKIAFLEGHDELNEYQTYDIMMSLSKYYQIDRVKMNQQLNALDEYAAVVIAKPQARFSEKDKFIIDQYIMKGGKVVWLVEWMVFDMDSLSKRSSEMAMIRDINLDDQLYKYGVRINPDLIQDLSCLNIPVCVNTIDGKPQFEPRPWFYFPLIVPDTLLNHPLLRNVEPMRTHFVSSIDTVGENSKVKKTILLRTSQYSKSMIHPVEVSLEIMRENPELLTFNQPNLPIAVLLEGTFESAFKNRLSYEFYTDPNFVVLDISKPTKMIVISDGDFIRNEVRSIGEKKQPYPLGYDKYYSEQYTPGNTQFFVNCINYLCADEDLISLRMREIKIRNLDRAKIKNQMLMWIYVNSFVPVLIIIALGLMVLFLRNIKYRRIKFNNGNIKK